MVDDDVLDVEEEPALAPTEDADDSIAVMTTVHSISYTAIEAYMIKEKLQTLFSSVRRENDRPSVEIVTVVDQLPLHSGPIKCDI